MFTNPLKNLRTLGLREDSIVADLGAGTGHYSLHAGKIVHKGKVYAVDIVKEFLHTLKKKAHEVHLPNIEIIWGNVEKKNGTSLKNELVDAVVASNVFFQIGHKDIFVEEIKRILKPKGRVLLVDWSDNNPVLSAKRIFPKHLARELFEKKGFVVDREIDAGGHHYGMILVKN